MIKLTDSEVLFRVKRYRPESGKGPFYQDYRVPYRKDKVVLDGLNYIKDNIDPTLTYRWSCRMGVCGSCGMMVNHKPVLTCGTFVRDVNREGGVLIEPLISFNIIKDLVVDMTPFMNHLSYVRPWIMREEEPKLEHEYHQTPEQVNFYHQQSACINCTLCYSGCPVFQGDSSFVGPAALAILLRYVDDSRNKGQDEQLGLVSVGRGIWECTLVGECSAVCPKNVDPAAAIQILKVLALARHIEKPLKSSSREAVKP